MCLFVFINIYIAQNTYPTVSNVSHSYNSATGFITVSYDVTDAEQSIVNVLMEVSSDGGETFNYVCTMVSSDIGEAVETGNGKTILLDHDTELGAAPLGSNFTIKIVTDDVVGDQIYYEGKVYNTVTIGSQIWHKENLEVGLMIQGYVGDNGVIEKYCWDNNPANCETYGGLYELNEAMQYVTTEGAQGICPTGWHIPTNAEFQTLSTSVSGNSNQLKALGQGSGDGAGVDVSGFSALLAGYRDSDAYYYDVGVNAFIWSSTEINASYANYMILNMYDNNIGLSGETKEFGRSVRCFKDLANPLR